MMAGLPAGKASSRDSIRGVVGVERGRGRGEESTEGWGVVLNWTDGRADEDAADEAVDGRGDEAAADEGAGGGAADEAADAAGAAVGPGGVLRLSLGPWTCSWLLVRPRWLCWLIAISAIFFKLSRRLD